MARILIVEDDTAISRFLTLELQHERYQTAVASDGRAALELAVGESFDLILLDIMLPSLSGIEVLRRLRQTKSTPVIMLTARDQVMDKVTGLDQGANDYMTKPFAIEELLARIRALLKRGDAASDGEGDLTAGGLTVQPARHAVLYGGVPVELTRKEFDLLVYIVRNKNRVLTRDLILNEVWGYDFYGDTNVVDVYIRYLRTKIDERFGCKLIQTIRGTGYIVKDDKD
ncbi:MAG: response regulator transcription factor [Clostridiales bacterium]|jgi:DNA-binding response OmpR family regulator|nr:response regulator transcription factor [Clostridiales bacterium]